MKEWKTAAEWAAEGLAGLPGTESGMIRLLKREGWNDLGPAHARRRKGRGGGWEYHVNCLPDVAQADWTRRQKTMAANQLARQEREVVRAKVIDTPDKVAAHRRRVMEARGTVMVELRRREFIDGTASAAIANLLAEAKAGLLAKDLMEMLSASVEKGRGETPLPSRSRLFAWRQAYQDGGIRALLPEARPQESKAETPDWMSGFLRHYCKPTKPTLAKALDKYRASLPNPDHAPSYDQVRRALKGLQGSTRYLDAFKGREGPLALKARLGFKRRTIEGMEPTEVYTADGKTFEAEVAHPISGAPFRPEITAIVDVVTRKLVGWSVDLAENSRGVADALRHASETHGIAAIFYTDRGPGFRNDALDGRTQGILGRLGTTPTHSLPYVSQSRGIIERSHQTIWTDLAKSFPSYVGADMDREARMARDKVRARDLKAVGSNRLLPSWDDFVAGVAAAVDAYNSRPHSALRIRDAETGRMRRASPNEVWADFVAQGFEPIPMDASEIDDLFRPYVKRRAARGEVQWNNNHYYHDALQPFDGMDVLVGIDIHDARRVWVRRLEHYGTRAGMGALICVADFYGKKERYFPHSMTQKAKEDRLKGQKRRVMTKVDAIDAEARGVMLIAGEAFHPAQFIDLEPGPAPALAQPQFASSVAAPAAEAVLTGAPRRDPREMDEETEMAVRVMADPNLLTELTPGWREAMREKASINGGRFFLERAGVDPWALLELLRSAA